MPWPTRRTGEQGACRRCRTHGLKVPAPHGSQGKRLRTAVALEGAYKSFLYNSGGNRRGFSFSNLMRNKCGPLVVELYEAKRKLAGERRRHLHCRLVFSTIERAHHEMRVSQPSDVTLPRHFKQAPQYAPNAAPRTHSQKANVKKHQ